MSFQPGDAKPPAGDVEDLDLACGRALAESELCPFVIKHMKDR
jgi:hypothetical protein